MRDHRSRFPVVSLVALGAALLLSGCGSVSMPSFGGFGGGSEAPPPPPVESSLMPSKYNSEELVGRWGFTSYQKEADRARTVAAAGRLCRTPYVIAKGPTGGVMMHLADQRQPTELRLKGSPEGRNYIGPDGQGGGSPGDREIIAFDGRVLVTRYVDPDAANRYGNMVYVRCGPRA